MAHIHLEDSDMLRRYIISQLDVSPLDPVHGFNFVP